MRRAAAVLLAAVTCLWSYSLGWQRGYVASDLTFNRRLSELTRMFFEQTISANEASDEEARAHAGE